MLAQTAKLLIVVGYSEDLIGEALQFLYEKHGYKREDLFVQTK